MLSKCPRWIHDRTTLENYVGETLTITNIVEVVVSKNEFWKKFQEICQKMMKAGQAKENELERNRKKLSTCRVQNETNLNAER